MSACQTFCWRCWRITTKNLENFCVKLQLASFTPCKTNTIHFGVYATQKLFICAKSVTKNIIVLLLEDSQNKLVLSKIESPLFLSLIFFKIFNNFWKKLWIIITEKEWEREWNWGEIKIWGQEKVSYNTVIVPQKRRYCSQKRWYTPPFFNKILDKVHFLATQIVCNITLQPIAQKKNF